MRTVTVSLLAVLGGLGAARAADLDYDYLRGGEYDAAPVAAIDWSGVYVGGHGGFTATRFDFGHAGQSDIAHIVQNTAIESQFGVSTMNRLTSKERAGGSYGGFVGYNFQFDDVVFGIEGDYTSVFMKAASDNAMGINGKLGTVGFADVSTTIRSKATLQDFGTIRARIGYAFGSFLPYVTGGFAIGRAITGSTVSVLDNEYTDSTRATQTGYLSRSGGQFKERYAPGFAIGLGGEYAVTSNVFLRAEYQYVKFGQFGDHKIDLNTARGAVGVKF